VITSNSKDVHFDGFSEIRTEHLAKNGLGYRDVGDFLLRPMIVVSSSISNTNTRCFLLLSNTNNIDGSKIENLTKSSKFPNLETIVPL
jgi:hypothetical protein